MVLRNHPFTPASATLQKARRLIDPKTGIIRWVAQRALAPGDPQVFVYVTEACDTARFGALHCSEHGGSAALHRSRAKAAAIGETIERYCSAIYDPSEFITAAYRDLPPQTATRPENFVLFSEHQYSQAEFHYERFTPDARMNWVTATSFPSGASCLVPACFVYVPYEFAADEPCITVSHSTGLACGNSPEEALLSALCEVVERDAFMLTWLHRFPAPRVALNNVRDETLAAILRALESAGLELHVNLITTDVEIPTFMATLIDNSGAGPAAAVATRADLNPTHGVIRVAEEAVLTWLTVKDMMERSAVADSESDGGSPSMFLSRSKYLLMYARRETLRNLDFLLSASGSVQLSEIKNRSSDDALTDFNLCGALVGARGFEVLAVDLTTPDIAEAGLAVTRIVVPGLQPLDIDEVRRFRGGQRLYQAPCLLGYGSVPANESDLCEEPHPFP